MAQSSTLPSAKTRIQAWNRRAKGWFIWLMDEAGIALIALGSALCGLDHVNVLFKDDEGHTVVALSSMPLDPTRTKVQKIDHFGPYIQGQHAFRPQTKH